MFRAQRDLKASVIAFFELIQNYCLAKLFLSGPKVKVMLIRNV